MNLNLFLSSHHKDVRSHWFKLIFLSGTFPLTLHFIQKYQCHIMVQVCLSQYSSPITKYRHITFLSSQFKKTWCVDYHSDQSKLLTRQGIACKGNDIARSMLMMQKRRITYIIYLGMTQKVPDVNQWFISSIKNVCWIGFAATDSHKKTSRPAHLPEKKHFCRLWKS